MQSQTHIFNLPYKNAKMYQEIKRVVALYAASKVLCMFVEWGVCSVDWRNPA
jgi:hypothetical protein